ALRLTRIRLLEGGERFLFRAEGAGPFAEDSVNADLDLPAFEDVVIGDGGGVALGEAFDLEFLRSVAVAVSAAQVGGLPQGQMKWHSLDCIWCAHGTKGYARSMYLEPGPKVTGF